MKKNSKLIGAMAFVLTFVAGYAVGLLVDLPNIDSKQASGTIGRVNNYRNAKATEGEIALKNDLLKDNKQQKAMVKYLNYYYTRSLAYAQTTSFVLEQAEATPAFASQSNKQLEAMKGYEKYLENSRKILLMAALQCQSVESAEPSALRNSLDQSFNVVARMGQYQPMVLTFMDQLETFLSKNDAKTYAGLSQAYDKLLYDQLSSVIISQDKVLASYLNKKHMYASELQRQQPNVKEAVLVDLKTLNEAYPRDLEKLGIMDKETLGRLDKEQLGKFDAEQLGLFDSEKLGFFGDMEKMAAILDTEQLGLITLDTEKLGAIAALDAEKLGACYTDAEKLGVTYKDKEQLGSLLDLINDTEQLGSLLDLINDSEQLGSISDLINDSEQLGLRH